MSEFMVVATEQKALREKEKNETTENLEQRVNQLESKLQDIKVKMEKKRVEKKFF